MRTRVLLVGVAIALLGAAVPCDAQPFAYVLKSAELGGCSPRTLYLCYGRLLIVDIERGELVGDRTLDSSTNGPLARTSDGRYLAWSQIRVHLLDRVLGTERDLSSSFGGLIEAAPSGHRFYFLDGSLPGLRSVDIDGSTFEVPISTDASGIVVSPDGKTAYVGRRAGVAVVDLETHTLATTVNVPGNGNGPMAISTDGSRLFALRYEGEDSAAPVSLYAMLTASRSLDRNVSLPYPAELAVVPNGSALWIADRESYLTTIAAPLLRELDPVTLAQRSTIAVPAGYRYVQNIAITADSAQLIVTTLSPPALHVFNLSTRALARTVALSAVSPSATLSGLVLSKPTDVCTYKIAPTTATVSADGGNISIDVPALAGCAWATSDAADWLTDIAPPQGTGAGTVTARITPNRNATSRTAALSIGLQRVLVTQDPEPTASGAPLAPTGLSASLSIGPKATLSWSPAFAGVPPTHYVVEVGRTSGDRDFVAAPVGLQTTVSGGPLTPGVYFARVRGVNGAGGGPASAEISFTVPTLPPAPTGLAITWTEPASATLTWSGAHPLTPGLYSIVEAGRSPGVTDIGSAQASGRLSIARDALPEGTYYLRVREGNVTGLGPPSSDVVLRLGVCTSAPPAPSFLAYLTTNRHVFARIDVSSSEVIDTFRLTAGSTAGGTDFGVFDVTWTMANVPLPPGRYFVRAQAVNRCGTSASSSEVTFNVP